MSCPLLCYNRSMAWKLMLGLVFVVYSQSDLCSLEIFSRQSTWMVVAFFPVSGPESTWDDRGGNSKAVRRTEWWCWGKTQNGWVVNRLMLMPELELKLKGSVLFNPLQVPDSIHQDIHQQMFFDKLHGMDKDALHDNLRLTLPALCTPESSPLFQFVTQPSSTAAGSKELFSVCVGE